MRYRRERADDKLPSIARIWGAIRDGEAAAIVDQENLRTWVWVDGAHQELTEENALHRVLTAAALVSA